MNPIVSIIDNYFQDAEAVRREVLGGSFKDLTSPLDGITYPAINRDLPAGVVGQLEKELSRLFDRRVQAKILFSRAMFEGMLAPNKIHSDLIMGRWAAHVYLSREWPEGAGTTFWTNKKLGPRHTPEMDPGLIRSNVADDWSRYLSVQAQFNRCLVHRGDAWHLAEPVGGWGTTPSNARLVITAFFD